MRWKTEFSSEVKKSKRSKSTRDCPFDDEILGHLNTCDCGGHLRENCEMRVMYIKSQEF